MKILITENQLSKLMMEIRASEGYDVLSSILSVIQGKRGVGFDSIGYTQKYLLMLVKNGLDFYICPSNEQNVVFFRPEYEKDAKELLHIAEKYGGYLAWNATEKDARRIGELLGYEKEDIDDYIKNHWNT